MNRGGECFEKTMVKKTDTHLGKGYDYLELPDLEFTFSSFA